MEKYMPSVSIDDTEFAASSSNKNLLNAGEAARHALTEFERKADQLVRGVAANPNLTETGKRAELESGIGHLADEFNKVAKRCNEVIELAATRHASSLKELSANVRSSRPDMARETRDRFQNRSKEQQIALLRDSIHAAQDNVEARDLLIALHEAPEYYGLVSNDTRREIGQVLAKVTNPSEHRATENVGLVVQCGRERWEIAKGEVAKRIANIVGR